MPPTVSDAARPVRPDARGRAAGAPGWNAGLAIELLVLLLIWQVAVGHFKVWDPAMMPPPAEIGQAFLKMLQTGILAKNFWFSAQNFVAGYLLAALIGLVVGLLMGSSPVLNRLLSSFVWTIYAVPRIAIAPLLVLWLGFGHASKIVVIFLMAVFPILVNAMEGVRTVEPSLIRAGRVFGASHFALYLKVILPASLPLVLTGLRLGVARGLVGVVVGEFIGAAAGLGYMIVRSAASFDMASAFAITILLVVMANLSMMGLTALKQRLAPWDEEGAEAA
jgi:NitT/TauT family transport system permease protein